MSDATTPQRNQVQDFSKGMYDRNFEKRFVGTWKNRIWSRYFLSLFYPSNTPFLYDDALIIVVQSFPIDLKPIEHLFEWSISNPAMFVRLFTYLLTFFHFVGVFLCPSLIYFLAVWHDHFVATECYICRYHFAAIGMARRTNWETN